MNNYIALSTKRIGALLVTNNTKDFFKIKEFVNFKIIVEK